MKELFPPDYDEHEYNPRASEVLAQWRPGEDSGLFRCEAETLYKTAKGNYFILRERGLISQGGSPPESPVWYGGSSIKPLTAREAVSWCEETGNYETIDKYLFLYKKNF